jgi:crotonobetainyl-CoA:carnitine CoA-transferase CaiB-like acyl-CoA transferase
VDAFNAAGMPTGPVYSAEDVFEDEHFRVRGMLPVVDDPEVGPYIFARSTPLLSGSPEIPLRAAPALGAHTQELLEELLGYDGGAIDQLAAEGVIGR